LNRFIGRIKVDADFVIGGDLVFYMNSCNNSSDPLTKEVNDIIAKRVASFNFESNIPAFVETSKSFIEGRFHKAEIEEQLIKAVNRIPQEAIPQSDIVDLLSSEVKKGFRFYKAFVSKVDTDRIFSEIELSRVIAVRNNYARMFQKQMLRQEDKDFLIKTENRCLYLIYHTAMDCSRRKQDLAAKSIQLAAQKVGRFLNF